MPPDVSSVLKCQRFAVLRWDKDSASLFLLWIHDRLKNSRGTAWSRALACSVGLLASAAVLAGPEDGATPASLITADSITITEVNQTAFDNNVFSLPSSGISVATLVGPTASREDHVESLGAGLDAQGGLSKQSGELSVQVNKNWFLQNRDLNNTSIHGNALLDWSVGPALSGQAGAVYTRTLADFAYTGVYVKDLVESADYFNSTRLQLSPRWLVFGGASLAKTSQSAPELTGNNFHQTTGDIGAQWLLDASDFIGTEYSFTSEHFPDIVILGSFPFDRNFHESIEKILVKKHFGAFLTLDGNVGYIERSYPHSTIGAFSGVTCRASLDWKPGAKAEMTLSGWRELRAFVETESSYFVADGLSVSSKYNATTKLQFSGKLSTERQDFIPTDAAAPFTRHDRMTSAQVAATYSPREQVLLQLSYEDTLRNSTIDLYEFDAEVYMAQISFQF